MRFFLSVHFIVIAVIDIRYVGPMWTLASNKGSPDKVTEAAFSPSQSLLPHEFYFTFVIYRLLSSAYQ